MPTVKTRLTKRFPAPPPPDVEQPWQSLEDRTARFGENIIRFVKRLPINAITEPLIKQLVQTSTSIGADYCIADCSTNKKKRRKCLARCIESARSAKYWLRMIATALPLMKREARTYWKEAEELNLIFASMYRRKKSK